MSFIRCSTKVAGQKNDSRTYAWWDVEGGVIINGRDLGGVDANTSVLVSIPEMLYMCEQFMSRVPKSRSARYKWLKKAHHGFYTRYDKLYEQYQKKSDKNSLFRWAFRGKGKRPTKQEMDKMLAESKKLWAEYREKAKKRNEKR